MTNFRKRYIKMNFNLVVNYTYRLLSRQTHLLLFRRVAVTQFSPTHARRAFPCMDEPHLKAEFQVRIGHHKEQMATSNTPVESEIELVYRLSNRRTRHSLTPSRRLQRRRLPRHHVPPHAANLHVSGGLDGAQLRAGTIGGRG